ncbi:uncharacterized protein LOC100898114 [Galendromus occidentalis]|uniref:Uncharacterized protein LOC100898114 n=1 Tax=Galendromus occidentalis TaxID=34638 RepID=A0AAJ6QR88_9ACAR|nr:uncharacterized protein LOC100898114 [Galendromus occidentalis]
MLLYNLHTVLSISQSGKPFTLRTVFVEFVRFFRVSSVTLTFILTLRGDLITKYEELSRRGRRNPSRLLKNFRIYVYAGFSLSSLLQIISNDRHLQDNPENYLASHFYGLSVREESFFRSSNAFRFYVFVDYLLLSLQELYLYRVMCLFCDLAFRLSENIRELRGEVYFRNDSVFCDITSTHRLCQGMNMDFSELLATWCAVAMMTVIGFIQTCIEAFQSVSQSVVARVLASPSTLLVSIWFCLFCCVAKKPYQEASLFRDVLNELNRRARVEIREEILYLKLMYRLCDGERFTIKVWRTVAFSNNFLSRTFPNILMFGVTLHQVANEKSRLGGV